MKLITECEMIILNKISWKVYLLTPIDIAYTLISKPTMTEEVIKSFASLITYCFNESNIYYKYNQFEISLACLYISYNQLDTNQLCKDLKIFIDPKIISSLITDVNTNIYYKYPNSKNPIDK
jgi:hypothetical protein